MEDPGGGGGNFRPRKSLARTPPGSPYMELDVVERDFVVDATSNNGPILRGTSTTVAAAATVAENVIVVSGRSGKRKVVSPETSQSTPAPKRMNEDRAPRSPELEEEIRELAGDVESIFSKIEEIDSFVGKFATKKSVSQDDRASVRNWKVDLKESIVGLVQRFQAHCARMEGFVEGAHMVVKLTKKEMVNDIVNEVRAAECRLECNLQTLLQSAPKQPPQVKTVIQQVPVPVSASYAERVKLPAKMAVQTTIRPPLEKLIVYPRVVAGTEKDASQKVREIVRETFKDQRLSLKIKGVRDVRKGGIIIETAEKGSSQAIVGGLKSHPDLIVRNTGSRQPRLFIYDVPRAMADEEIFECIRGQNLEGVSKDDFSKEFKLLFKTGPREGNSLTCHWVVEVSPTLRKKLIDRPRIYVDWTSCRIRDYASVTRCWKCQSFGHPEKYCRQDKPTCGHCSTEGHETKNCSHLAEAPKCTNCKRFGKPYGHSAKDANCPAYLRALENEIGRTDFGA